MLHEYLKALQGFLRDRAQRTLSPEDLISYINRARREIALRTQCVRVLTPIAGQIESITVTYPGSGYSNPLVLISAPDAPNGAQPYPGGAQAIAVAQQVGGQITNVSMTFGGDGYFQPSVSIIDSSLSGLFVLGQSKLGGPDVLGYAGISGIPGANATAVANITPICETQGFQEVYPFSSVSLAMYPGLGKIFAVNSVSIIFANYRYSLPIYPFSVYQSMIRQYPQQYLYVPTFGSQFGQGTNGSFYLYPIASTRYQMEWDCFCTPAPLRSDGDFEAIAEPWTDAVPIGAAVYAYEEIQNLNASRYYQEKFDQYVHRYSAYARPGRVTNPYGRY
jgi:hypothetical protein